MAQAILPLPHKDNNFARILAMSTHSSLPTDTAARIDTDHSQTLAPLPPSSFAKGQRVRVACGPLLGLMGNVEDASNPARIVVSCALLRGVRFVLGGSLLQLASEE